MLPLSYKACRTTNYYNNTTKGRLFYRSSYPDGKNTTEGTLYYIVIVNMPCLINLIRIIIEIRMEVHSWCYGYVNYVFIHFIKRFCKQGLLLSFLK